MKTCAWCKKEKINILFDKSSQNKDGLRSYCKKCQKIVQKEFYNKHGFKNQKEYVRDKANRDIVKHTYRVLVSTRKVLGIKIHFSLLEFKEWYNKQSKQCYYCDIKEEDIIKNRELMPRRNIVRLTLDRLDSQGGYKLNNLVLACYRCNLIKGNFFTEKEMLEIGKIVKNKWI